MFVGVETLHMKAGLRNRSQAWDLSVSVQREAFGSAHPYQVMEGVMLVLRTVRFLCGLGGIASFVLGVIGLFQGNWILLGGSIVVWLILMMIWYSAHQAVERLELAEVQHLSRVTGTLISTGDWQGALAASTQTVQVLQRSARSGAGAQMTGPLAAARVGHAFILGANGDIGGARDAIDSAIPVLNKLSAAGNAAAVMMLQIAAEADGRLRTASVHAAEQFCRQSAREIHG